jgi:hypothetical protein
MIEIKIIEDCPACKKQRGLVGIIHIDGRHLKTTEHEPGKPLFDSSCCADSLWTHPGFQYDGCIRITCSACGAQAGLDIGDMEFTVTGQQYDDPAPSWCPSELGELQ